MIPNLNTSKKIKERAIDASCLDERILKNVKHQRIDLVKWIFNRAKVISGSYVLELCSGTGNQTIALLKQVGKNGKVFALDISEKALKKLTDKTPVNLKDCLITIPASIDNLQHLLKKISPEIRYFDLIFCQNALDHTYDPVKAIDEMIKLMKDSGAIYLLHIENEGFKEGYRGLHSWNFTQENGVGHYGASLKTTFLKNLRQC